MTSRVPRTRRIALVGLSVATLVGAAALSGVVATSAQAVDPIPRFITIATANGADTEVRLISTTGTPIDTQTLSNPDSTKCNITSSSPPVITFSGATGNQGTTTPVGQRFGKLGVAEKLTGESCAQVSQTGREVLTLDLGTSLVASRAVLDIELQKDAIVTAEFFRGNSRLTAVDLQTGTSIGAALQTGSARADVCQTSSSSGPNSAANDNCRWVLSGGLFTKLVLKAAKGNFSLMGGADGPVANRTATEPSGPSNTLVSYFKIAEECPATTKVTQISSSGSSALPTGSVGRSPINADGSLCLDDELTATAVGSGIVDIIKSGQPYAQYVVKIDWKKAPTTIAALSEAINRTTIEFDIGNGQLSAPTVLPWCPTSLRVDATSQPEPATGGRVLKAITDADSPANGIADELTDLNIRDMDGVTTNSVQSACILDRDVNFDGTWYVVSDMIYVLGDLRMRS